MLQETLSNEHIIAEYSGQKKKRKKKKNYVKEHK